jgi:hypothetical protein
MKTLLNLSLYALLIYGIINGPNEYNILCIVLLGGKFAYDIIYKPINELKRRMRHYEKLRQYDNRTSSAEGMGCQ